MVNKKVKSIDELSSWTFELKGFEVAFIKLIIVDPKKKLLEHDPMAFLRFTFFNFILVLALFGISEAKTGDNKANNSNTIKEVNAAVDELEKRISTSDKSLPTVKVEYDFHDATEGVPPDMKFYFENVKIGLKEKAQLRVFKTHVGREVYGIDRSYYFDEKGKPMKFLEINSGISGADGVAGSRQAVIYDKLGNKIWSTPETVAPMSFDDVKSIFNTLDKGLAKFQ